MQLWWNRRGKKDGIKGRVNSVLDIFSTEKILRRGRRRKMNILIFITSKRRPISEARVWKQVSVHALFLLVIFVLSGVFKFRQIHLQGTNEFIIKIESKKIDSSRQTLTEKELAQAGQEITKNTEREQSPFYLRENLLQTFCVFNFDYICSAGCSIWFLDVLIFFYYYFG